MAILPITQTITPIPPEREILVGQKNLPENIQWFASSAGMPQRSSEINTILGQLNTTVGQMNYAVTDVNNKTVIATTKASEASVSASSASSSATLAQSAATAIQGYVVPTDATYTFSEIDKLSSVAYPNSGYTQVSKKLDNFVFQTSSSFLNKVADKNRYVKFGDKVVDTYGQELVTNGDFSNGTTGWTQQSTLLNENGIIKATTTTSSSLLYQTLNTTSGKTYRVKAQVKAGTTGVAVAIRNNVDTATIIISSTITETSKFTEIDLIFVSQGNDKIRVYANTSSAGYYVYFDNISVREIQTATHTIQNVTEIVQNGTSVTSVQINQGDYAIYENINIVGLNVISSITHSASAPYISTLNLQSPADSYFNKNWTIYYVLNNGSLGSITSLVSPTSAINISTGDYYITSVYRIQINYLQNDVFRAKQTAPIGTALTNTTYFEDRTQIGVTNSYLDGHKEDSGVYVGKVSELLLSDVSKEDLLDNPTWLARNGYSKVSQYLYSKGISKYAISAIFNSLNKGLYHQELNPMGSKKASDDKYWYDTTVSFTSVADCFNPTKLLTASGYIASGVSGRPDGKYYDICYSDLVHDVREYAKILNRDEVNLIVADKEENGVDEVVSMVNVSQVGSNYIGTYYTAINAISGYDKNKLIGTNFYHNGFASRIESVTDNTTTWNLVTTTLINRVVNEPVTIVIKKPILSSSTKLSIDLIGNPTNYPQVLKDRLASGVGIVGLLPDLVDDTGASNLPNGTKTVFKLNGKFTTTHQVLKSTDSGVTWSLLSLTTHCTVNTTTNSITFVTAPAATDMILITDTDKCLPYIQTTPKPVIDVEPKVIASNSHSIYKGALIGNQVSGKIQVGNGANGYESKVLEETGNVANYNSADGTVYISTNQTVFLSNNKFGTGVNGRIYKRIGISGTHDLSMQYYIGNTFGWSYVGDSGIYEIPTHSTIALDNANSVASKWFKAISQGSNGVVGSVYGKELAYNTITSSYDGDNELFDQLTNGTKTDLNAKTVRTFVGHIPINGEVK